MTRFRVGSASDVGQVRTANQDSKLIADDVSVFAVADGMGGHQGGEVASAIAVETLEATITEPTQESVVEAVKEANRRIFAHADDEPQLRGMGTTLVGIALVNQGSDDEEMTWVNVGDSRVYLLRDEELIQLSRDHSLVEDLRRGGQLSAEEAAIHPQRNILTRALGIDAEVEVDSASVIPLRGDRYLLCSDGLFNEVDPDTLVDTLVRIDDPDEAAAELVRLANAGGGRDNITCIIVDVVDDGGRSAAAATAAAVPAGRPSEAPTDPGLPAPTAGRDDPTVDLDATPPAGLPAAPPPEPVDPTLDEPAPAGTDGSEDPTLAAGISSLPYDGDEPPTDADDLPFGRSTGDVYEDLDRAGGRHSLTRVLLVVVVLAVVAAAAVGAIRWFDSDGYFVRADGDAVVIYQGKPDGGIIFGPEEKERGATAVSDLAQADRQALDDVPTFSSLANARSTVRAWDANSEDTAEPDTTTTTTTTTTTEPTTTTESQTATSPDPTIETPSPQPPADGG